MDFAHTLYFYESATAAAAAALVAIVTSVTKKKSGHQMYRWMIIPAFFPIWRRESVALLSEERRRVAIFCPVTFPSMKRDCSC